MIQMNNNRFFELREYNNLTQKELATIFNVKQQTYSDWENSKKIIPLKHLVTLANYYHLSINYILGLSNIKKELSTQIKIDKTKISQNLIVIRKENNLLQKDLAKALNTTPSTICAYEKGKTTILTAFAYQICKKYQISFDDLIGASASKTLK